MKCFVVMAAEAPLGKRASRAVLVLPPEGAESNKRLFPNWCLKDDWTNDYAKCEAFESEDGAVTDPDDRQKWRKGLAEEDCNLYQNGKLLVPECQVLKLCEAWHQLMMHARLKKQASDMQRPFEIGEIGLYKAIKQVRKDWLDCQG